jgi:futalosine hydrolase
MRLLIAAATAFELEHFQHFLDQKFEKTAENLYCRNNLEVYVSITGIGMMRTAFALAEAINSFRPHFALQAGVAGAFNRDLKLGSLVIIQAEVLGDLGVEDHNIYRDMFDIELTPVNEQPFANKKLINSFQDFPLRLNLPFVSSLTVNTVSGSSVTIRKREEKYGCDIESMEGAAFHYACLMKKVPFLQVRSISNYVEPRDRSKWKMKEAIRHLNDWMIDNVPADL